MSGAMGPTVLTVDEATVLVALLHHAGDCLPPAIAAIARDYAERVRCRADDAESEAEPGDRREAVVRRYALLRQQSAALARELAMARERSARLRDDAARWHAEARAVRDDAERMRREARTLRHVLADVISLIGGEGPLAFDANDAALVGLREELRLAVA